MDQTRRFVLFLLVTGAVWFGWFGYVQPKFFPVPQKPKAPAAADVAGTDDADDEAEDGPAGVGAGAAAVGEVGLKQPLVRPENPRRVVKLGSGDPKTGYFQEVTLDSRGAAVESIALNDDRYKDLAAGDKSLKVVGNTADPAVTTFQTRVAVIDDQLAEFKTDSTRVDWKVESVEKDADGVPRKATFSLRAPDGSVEVVKTYSLTKVKDGASPEVRDTNARGYVLAVELAFRNLTDKPQTVAYTLQGPEGLPLENEEHTSKYRELELGFLDEEGELNATAMTAADATEKVAGAKQAEEAEAAARAADREVRRRQRTVADLEAEVKATPGDNALKTKLAEAKAEAAAAEEEAKRATDYAQEVGRGLERWSTPFRYLGVEVQYFASLLLPESRPFADQIKSPRVRQVEPVMVAERKDGAQFNDVSFKLESTPIALPPNGTVVQKWELFAGPKRETLLEPLGADGILDTGRFLWFQNAGWVAAISGGMLWVMGKIHALGASYWLAIICLTVLVRGAMFPISRKQAILAAKMKEFQPKLTELKAKFGDDQEKFLKAQMELFRKHGYGPLGPMVSASGCLPIFLQLPIFVGLYNALQNSVDLRRAGFLWIDNLAAPDALFRFPFVIPYLGSDFNILPLITVVLFYIQQKLFMPPATTPEQEAQYKMMNFMMLFMGVFFYHVPAGLCLYFIASSLWSITERKLLAKTREAHVSAAESAEIDHEIEEMTAQVKKPAKPGKGKPGKFQAPVPPSEPNKPSWLERLFEAAEQARKQSELGGDKTKPTGPKSKSRPRKF